MAATGLFQFRSSLRVQNLESSPDGSFVAQHNPQCIVARLGNMGSTLFGAGTVTEAAGRLQEGWTVSPKSSGRRPKGHFSHFLFSFVISCSCLHLLTVPSDVGAKIPKLFVLWFDY